jgi:hypothetical protein
MDHGRLTERERLSISNLLIKVACFVEKEKPSPISRAVDLY